MGRSQNVNESLCIIGALADAQDGWILEWGGDSIYVFFNVFCIGLKITHFMTLNEGSYNTRISVMLSLIAEFSQGSSAAPPSWKRSESTGFFMLNQWFFILEEVIKFSETLWILFPGKSTQHI